MTPITSFTTLVWGSLGCKTNRPVFPVFPVRPVAVTSREEKWEGGELGGRAPHERCAGRGGCARLRCGTGGERVTCAAPHAGNPLQCVCARAVAGDVLVVHTPKETKLGKQARPGIENKDA